MVVVPPSLLVAFFKTTHLIQWIDSPCVPIPECPNKLIKGWSLSSNLSNPLLIYWGGVHSTSTWYELEDTSGHDVMGLWCLLVLAFSIQAIEYEFNFDLFSGVVINQVIPPSGDNISILSLELFTSKTKSVVLMPIVFVDKSQTPIRTISFSSILS